ncbi:hypothetical protein PMG11_04852 [Penicillium brasilianum]|uniref:Uncharacterized protein n=1 Tax=Penicillium brasilianum TaxID=104259 RepID=A0A0F7VE15_PENBI|nr:hypothetical protein PMG11_04852 [Penicillium brasilianum]
MTTVILDGLAIPWLRPFLTVGEHSPAQHRLTQKVLLAGNFCYFARISQIRSVQCDSRSQPGLCGRVFDQTQKLLES